MKDFLAKIKVFLERLSSKPQFDGLKVSEASLEYVSMSSGKPVASALRLPPGVFKDGKLSDQVQFSEYLNKLHKLAAPENPERVIRVTLVLPASMVYTQSFSVPNVGRERLREAVNLNLQMISPIPVADANMSAEIVKETPDNVDLFGAFANKKTIDQLDELLLQARFSPIAFEFPAQAITRLIRHSNKLNQKSTLVFQVSSEGLDIFILKEGALYFNYFRSWGSIQGEERSISRAVFDEMINEETKKVMNFSSSRFGEVPSAAVIIAPGFEAEVSGLLERGFGIRATPLALDGIAPSFYAAFGAALRGKAGAGGGEFEAVNLGGEDLMRAIYDEQILNFISLWRNISVVILVVLLVSLIFADSFLVNQSRNLKGQLAVFSVSGSQKEIADLSAKVDEFNGLVSAIKSVRGAALPWYGFLKHLGDLAASSSIRIKSLDISSISGPIVLYGTAANYSSALDFKNVLASDPSFSNVALPITQISIASDNTASFSVSFQVNLSR